MNPKLRALLSILAGIVVGTIVMYWLEMLSPYQLPPGMNENDPASLSAWVATLPLSAFVIILLAYFLGSVAGAWVTNKIAAPTHYRPALIVGFGLFVIGLMNLISISHPTWFGLISSLIYFAGAWLGGRIARRTQPNIY